MVHCVELLVINYGTLLVPEIVFSARDINDVMHDYV